MKYCGFLLMWIFCFAGNLQAQKIQLLQQDTSCSIRGLSVIDDKIAWLSGSKGHVAFTLNGGKTWKWQQVKGFEQSDFRDVEAFSAKEAIIMSSGTPALILKTTDAGESWKVVYRNNDKACFLDAMAFANAKTGYVLGDPVDQSFLLLQTNDRGNSWKMMLNPPKAISGEAAFAASGTCLQVFKKCGSLVIVTGGTAARVLLGVPSKKWLAADLPIAHGMASQGAFSAVYGDNNWIVVGGDYQQNKKTDSTACNYNSRSKSNPDKIAGSIPSGFQSSVEHLYNQTFLSAGTSGSNITTNGGKTWQQINPLGFNVCQKAKHGNLVLLAGDNGKIARFVKD